MIGEQDKTENKGYCTRQYPITRQKNQGTDLVKYQSSTLVPVDKDKVLYQGSTGTVLD